MQKERTENAIFEFDFHQYSRAEAKVVRRLRSIDVNIVVTNPSFSPSDHITTSCPCWFGDENRKTAGSSVESPLSHCFVYYFAGRKKKSCIQSQTKLPPYNYYIFASGKLKYADSCPLPGNGSAKYSD